MNTIKKENNLINIVQEVAHLAGTSFRAPYLWTLALLTFSSLPKSKPQLSLSSLAVGMLYSSPAAEVSLEGVCPLS